MATKHPYEIIEFKWRIQGAETFIGAKLRFESGAEFPVFATNRALTIRATKSQVGAWSLIIPGVYGPAADGCVGYVHANAVVLIDVLRAAIEDELAQEVGR